MTPGDGGASAKLRKQPITISLSSGPSATEKRISIEEARDLRDDLTETLERLGELGDQPQEEETWHRFIDRSSSTGHQHETFVPDSEYDAVVDEGSSATSKYEVHPEEGGRTATRSGNSGAIFFEEDEREEITAAEALEGIQ